jgi:hypothetical protein
MCEEGWWGRALKHELSYFRQSRQVRKFARSNHALFPDESTYSS